MRQFFDKRLMPVKKENKNKCPDGNVHTMPMDGPEHLESKDCWCKPDIIQDSRLEGGCIAYLHKESQ